MRIINDVYATEKNRTPGCAPRAHHVPNVSKTIASRSAHAWVFRTLCSPSAPVFEYGDCGLAPGTKPVFFLETVGSMSLKRPLPDPTDSELVSVNRADVKEPEASHTITKLFTALGAALDERLERRERFVRASRDLTMAAKKAIFELQRLKSSLRRLQDTQTQEAWAKTEQTFDRLQGLLRGGILKELEATPAFSDTYWQYHQVFSPGVQEYVEALAFRHWFKDAQILQFQAACEKLAPFPLEVSDYLLGLCDASGEVMRLAVQSSALGEQGVAFEASSFLDTLRRECTRISARTRRAWPPSMQQDLDRKLVTMGESLQKVQDVCYRLCLRRAERAVLGLDDRDEADDGADAGMQAEKIIG